MTATSNPTPFDPDAMQQLRTRTLVASPEDFGIQPTADHPRVYGVLMDFPIDEETATIVSLCDGNASLYTTSTFGIIGGGAHESVRQQAREFVNAADQYFDNAVPTSEFPLPAADRVRFYLLSFDGVRVIDSDLQDISQGNHECTPLFAQGQSVMTQLRITALSNDQDGDASTSSGKEWFGEAGYVHCLLTSMSEGAISQIEIAGSNPVPSLVELVNQQENVRAWVQAQEFSYEQLDPKQVIRVIKQSANIGNVLFRAKKASLPTVHASDDGQAMAQVFWVTIGPFSQSAHIELAPQDHPEVVELQRQVDEASET